MKDKISILIELEKILFYQEIEIISSTLDIREMKLTFSYIDFIDIDRTLYFDNQYDTQNMNEISAISEFGSSGIEIPMFRDIDTNDLTYFLLQEENSELRYFLKEVKLDNLVLILDKVKSYVNSR